MMKFDRAKQIAQSLIPNIETAKANGVTLDSQTVSALVERQNETTTIGKFGQLEGKEIVKATVTKLLLLENSERFGLRVVVANEESKTDWFSVDFLNRIDNSGEIFETDEIRFAVKPDSLEQVRENEEIRREWKKNLKF